MSLIINGKNTQFININGSLFKLCTLSDFYNVAYKNVDYWLNCDWSKVNVNFLNSNQVIKFPDKALKCNVSANAHDCSSWTDFNTAIQMGPRQGSGFVGHEIKNATLLALQYQYVLVYDPFYSNWRWVEVKDIASSVSKWGG